jgi:hypothetical protein
MMPAIATIAITGTIHILNLIDIIQFFITTPRLSA